MRSWEEEPGDKLGVWTFQLVLELKVEARVESPKVLKSLIGQILLVILTIMKFAALVRTKANDIILLLLVLFCTCVCTHFHLYDLIW